MASTDVAPESDKGYIPNLQSPNAGDSHETQGVNTDDLPLKDGVPVLVDGSPAVPAETESESSTGS